MIQLLFKRRQLQGETEWRIPERGNYFISTAAEKKGVVFLWPLNEMFDHISQWRRDQEVDVFITPN